MKKLLLLASMAALTIPAFSQSVTGFWQGVLLQPSGPTVAAFPFAMRLVQDQASNVTGYSQIDEPNTAYYGRMSLAGTYGVGDFTFFESSVIQQNAPSTYRWCIKNGTLTYDAAARTLTGPWYAGTCSPGTIELYRMDVLTDSVFCRNDVKRLEVTGNNVGWYSDPQCTQLLASGNVYTPSISSTTHYYITQTNRNLRSQPLHLRVTVNNCTTTNTSREAAASGVAVYPVPAHDAVTVALPSDELLGSTYKVHNALGQTVAAGPLRQRQQAVDIRPLPLGVYVLEVWAATGQRLSQYRLLKH